MNLKGTITRYDTNKCGKCGAKISAGQSILVDVDASPKVPYCLECGEKILKGETAKPPANIEKTSAIDGLTWKINTLIGIVNKQSEQITELVEFIHGIQETWNAPKVEPKVEPKPKSKAKAKK